MKEIQKGNNDSRSLYLNMNNNEEKKGSKCRNKFAYRVSKFQGWLNKGRLGTNSPIASKPGEFPFYSLV